MLVFCVPPAGGSRTSFGRLESTPGVPGRVLALELPGRGTRAAEPPAVSITAAAKDVADVIAGMTADGPDREWALYGHSMGGLIAFEAARILQERSIPGGRHLFVSGCPAPQHGFGARWDEHTTDGEIRDFLREIAGLPPEITENADALAYYAALVRADEKLLANYLLTPSVPLGLPVTVIANAADPVTLGRDPHDWAEVVATVDVRAVAAASHSSVLSEPAETVRIIASTLVGESLRSPGYHMYVELMKKVLTNVIYEDPPLPSSWSPGRRFDRVDRQSGLDWPSVAHTMVGLRRLDNVQDCVERILADGIPGDFAETGVWRGGTCIFLRALLRAHGVHDRAVWCADSFEGMPEVVEGHPGDIDLATHRFNEVMGVPLSTVRDNFERYGLLDDQVRFLPGWFRDTLPDAPIRSLALLRLDGDLYESTTDALVHLYPRLSVGGFVIIDDYLIDVCRAAVHDYRTRHGIEDEIKDIDGYGVYWRKTA